MSETLTGCVALHCVYLKTQRARKSERDVDWVCSSTLCVSDDTWRE